MFNKNVFTQTDVVADLIKGINEADYKTKMEALRVISTKSTRIKTIRLMLTTSKFFVAKRKLMKKKLRNLIIHLTLKTIRVNCPPNLVKKLALIPRKSLRAQSIQESLLKMMSQ